MCLREESYYKAIVRYNRYFRRYLCYSVRMPNQRLLTTHRNKTIIIIKSPGHNKYYSEYISYYHIQCPENSIVHVTNISFELQRRLADECIDYVQFKCEKSNGRQLKSGLHCGNDTISHYCNGNVLVTFRTSKYNNYGGFHLMAMCERSLEQSLQGCLATSTYPADIYTYEESVKVKFNVVM